MNQDHPTDSPDDDNSIVIKIPKSIWQKSEAAPAVQGSLSVAHKAEILQRTGLSVVIGQRNSDYGLTDVQSLSLANHEQRLQVLALLRNPALYDKLPSLLNYLFELGRSTDAELRYFAGLAAVELTSVLPLSELKENLITPWARYSSPIVNRTAALALSRIVRDERHRSNTLNLLKHWIDLRQYHLNNTALLTYFEIVFLHPEETLDAVKKIVVNEYSLSFVPMVVALIERLYRKQPDLVIGRLYEWFAQTASTDLLVFAGLTFLELADIRDFCKQDAMRDRALDFAFRLWEGPRVPQRNKLQELTGEAIYTWAAATLAMPKTDPAQAQGIAWFHDLYGKCADTRQNRLDFYLGRWQMRDEARVAKLNFARKPTTPLLTAQDFSQLRPQR